MLQKIPRVNDLNSRFDVIKTEESEMAEKIY